MVGNATRNHRQKWLRRSKKDLMTQILYLEGS